MKQFTGYLRKTIDLTEAPARGLRQAFALPPDKSDIQNYALSAVKLRFAALDHFFGLDSNDKDIWEHRTKALLARKYKIELSDPAFPAKLAFCLD